jgi:ketosteroid isomerase-like protein
MRPDFAALRNAWAADLHEKRLEQSADLYAVDAIFVTSDGRRFVGRAAIRSLYRAMTSAFTSDIHFHSLAQAASGSLAYDTGAFDEVLTNPKTGGTQRLKGTYLTLYGLEAGRWLIIEQVWTGKEPTR